MKIRLTVTPISSPSPPNWIRFYQQSKEFYAKALRTFPSASRGQRKGAAERGSGVPRFTQLSHYPSLAPTLSGLGRECRQDTSCTPVIPPAIILWTLPDHVGSNILKAVFSYANYNANPSPSLCLQRRNSAQQSCLPRAHRAGAQLPSLISRGSCHSN